MSLTIEVDTQDLSEFFRRLGEATAEAVRPAAQAGTQVVYDKVRQNVNNIRSLTGNLKNSIYQVYSVSLSEPGKSAYYEVSWNYKKAPHGILVHFGHLVRYEYYQDDQGNVRPKVRPDKIGTPKPRGRNRAALDAYYVTLPQPYRTTPQPFIYDAFSVFPAARDAMMAELIRRINDRMEGR